MSGSDLHGSTTIPGRRRPRRQPERVRGHHEHGLDRLGGDGRESVVSITWSVDDLDPVSRGLLRALSGPTLEHDHDWRGEQAGGRRPPDLLYEIARGPGTVAPPSSWTGTDDVGTA